MKKRLHQGVLELLVKCITEGSHPQLEWFLMQRILYDCKIFEISYMHRIRAKKYWIRVCCKYLSTESLKSTFPWTTTVNERNLNCATYLFKISTVYSCKIYEPKKLFGLNNCWASPNKLCPNVWKIMKYKTMTMTVFLTNQVIFALSAKRLSFLSLARTAMRWRALKATCSVSSHLFNYGRKIIIPQILA